MVHSRACLRITLTAQRMAHFTRVGAALSNTVDSSIAHMPWKKSKPKREGGNRREKPDEMSPKYKRARLEVRIF